MWLRAGLQRVVGIRGGGDRVGIGKSNTEGGANLAVESCLAPRDHVDIIPLRRKDAMMVIDYDLGSPCEPVDGRVMRILQTRHGKVLDASYFAQIQHHHGGVPIRQYVNDAHGTTHRIGRFLLLIDNHSEFETPFQSSSEFPTRDARIDRGILTLIEEDSATAHRLFGGEKLLPFAALYRGSRHPDDLRLGDGEASFLAFLYNGQVRPQVVVWIAADAGREYERWSFALADGRRWDEPVRYSAFTVPVAKHFDDFLSCLRSDPISGE